MRKVLDFIFAFDENSFQLLVCGSEIFFLVAKESVGWP